MRMRKSQRCPHCGGYNGRPDDYVQKASLCRKCDDLAYERNKERTNDWYFLNKYYMPFLEGMHR